MINKISKTSLILTVISIFLTANILAQKPKVSPDTKVAALPKVTQVNETTIKEILKANGKPLLVNFWATWCVPCREEFPELIEIDKEYKGKIDFITISLDDPAEINRDVPKFLNEMKATMPAYLLRTNDESAVIGAITKDWAGGLPFSVLYNEKGELVYFKQGKIKIEDVKSKLDEVIKLNPTSNSSIIQINNLPINRSNIYSYKKGIEDAKNDIAEGKYKIKHYGLVPMASVEYTNELQKKHGIEIIYNGCLVSSGMVEYGKGYNEISKVAIKQKFNLDF